MAITLGHPLVDDYLEFVGARGARNTWLASAYDLKVFFEVVGKEPAGVTTADVFAFLAHQRTPRRQNVVRFADGEAGLSARTIARRLSSIAGLFEYLVVRGDAGVERNPVPRGLAGRRPGQRGRGGVKLVRRPKTLPRVLSPAEVDALLGVLRTQRDRAIVLAMLLAGLRRCEVLGLRLADVQVAARGPLRPPLRMRLNLDRSSRPSSTALELIPCGHVRATASYFRAGHLLLDSLTRSLQLEQEIQALDLPGGESPAATHGTPTPAKAISQPATHAHRPPGTRSARSPQTLDQRGPRLTPPNTRDP